MGKLLEALGYEDANAEDEQRARARANMLLNDMERRGQLQRIQRKSSTTGEPYSVFSVIDRDAFLKIAEPNGESQKR